MNRRIFFQAPVKVTPEYVLYQSSYSAQSSNDIVIYDEETVINPMDYVAVSKGEFDRVIDEREVLGELFHTYNFQNEEKIHTVLKHYAGRSMSSGDIVELRYPSGLVTTWLCCSLGWRKLKIGYLYS